MKNLLVIGARSLIGRRMPEAIRAAGWPEESVRYSSRQPVAKQGVILDTARPYDFQPDRTFFAVIVCAPIWLITSSSVPAESARSNSSCNCSN